MSNVQEVMDYIMNTPHNTNPMILKQKLEGLDNGGNGGGGKDKSLYGLPYRCNLMFAGEIQPKQDEYGTWIVDQEVEFSEEFVEGQMFMVFVGEKINDNKYGTIITHSYSRYNYELEEPEGCLSLDEQYNSWDALVSVPLDFIINSNQPIKIKGYWENENPFYLTVYRVVDAYQEEAQCDIQLEDFIDSSLLPIPTLFKRYEPDGETYLNFANRTYEQIIEQTKMSKYQAVLNISDYSYGIVFFNSIGYLSNNWFKFLNSDLAPIYATVTYNNVVNIQNSLGE